MDIKTLLAPRCRVELILPAREGASVSNHVFSRVVHVVLDQVLIEQPENDQAEGLSSLNLGDSLTVIAQAGRPYTFQTVVKGFKMTSPKGILLKAPLPEDVRPFEAREFARVAMVLPIRLSYPQDAVWKEVEGFTVDVSAGGMRFRSPHLFEQAQEIKIALQFRSEVPLLELKAKVMAPRLISQQQGLKTWYDAACQFMELATAEQSLILRECFRREAEASR